jgi:hypothetical protein
MTGRTIPLRGEPEFGNEIDLARARGYDALADSLLDAHERIENPQQAKVYSDNARWLLSKRSPRKYGDTINLNVNHALDLTVALDAAERRVAGPHPNVLDVDGSITDGGGIDALLE